MHKPESVLENETHEIPWDFEIQTDYQDRVLINKKITSHLVDYTVGQSPMKDHFYLKKKLKRSLQNGFLLRRACLYFIRLSSVQLPKIQKKTQ